MITPTSDSYYVLSVYTIGLFSWSRQRSVPIWENSSIVRGCSPCAVTYFASAHQFYTIVIVRTSHVSLSQFNKLSKMFICMAPRTCLLIYPCCSLGFSFHNAVLQFMFSYYCCHHVITLHHVQMLELNGMLFVFRHCRHTSKNMKHIKYHTSIYVIIYMSIHVYIYIYI